MRRQKEPIIPEWRLFQFDDIDQMSVERLEQRLIGYAMNGPYWQSTTYRYAWSVRDTCFMSMPEQLRWVRHAYTWAAAGDRTAWWMRAGGGEVQIFP